MPNAGELNLEQMPKRQKEEKCLLPQSGSWYHIPEQAKKNGKKIYHLNIGQPDIETPETMLNAIHNFPLKVVEYSHSAGIESYRRKLTTYYKKFNIDLDYTDIIITTGGSEAIEIAMMSCMDPEMKSSFLNHSIRTTMAFLHRPM